MKKKSTQELAYEVIKPIAEDLGFILVEVGYKKEFSGMVLSVCIDKEGGVNINDCEKLHRAIDEPLDIANISRDLPYNLRVSSYGLDRSLKTDYDFNKFLNKEIVLKFYEPTFNSKQITAVLLGWDSETIEIEYENDRYQMSKKLIANITPFIKF